MNIRELGKTWNELGENDPLWSILSSPVKKGNRWDVTEFFQTGVQDVEAIIEYLQSFDILPSGGQALDFGSGVGRLTQALTKFFGEVHGVDIAPSMVRLAQQYNRYPEKCIYHLNTSTDLALFDDQTFDFIYSIITLQHMEPEYSRRYIQEFLRVLRPFGVLLFQVPGRVRPRPASVPAPAPQQTDAEPHIEMYGIPQEEVVALLESQGGNVLDIQEQNLAGEPWEDFRYLVTKEPRPAETLLSRVHGTNDLAWFPRSGRQSVEDLRKALSGVGRTLESYGAILDFGCGCGRILLGLRRLAATNRLYGVDLDGEAIDWARQHLPGVTLAVHQPLPPLNFRDASFDLVYSHSAFAHLNEELQNAWLKELRRILKPGGHLVAGFCGEHAFLDVESRRGEALRRKRDAEGILFVGDERTSFHASWYVFRHWSRYFKIHAHHVRSSLGYQDLVVMEREAPSGLGGFWSRLRDR